jgi:hypothetical protein
VNHQGHCHCGSVRASLETRRPDDEIEVRACQCSHCRRRGAKTISDPEGHLHVTAAPGTLRRYRFGLGITDFLLCRECGDYIAAVMEEDGRVYGVLNVLAADIQPFASRQALPMNYDGEDVASRVGRRTGKWTPATVVEAQPSA